MCREKTQAATGVRDMATEKEQDGTGGRKRKIKFSDKEIEILTEECCENHEKLFGRASMVVPGAVKKKYGRTCRTG